MAIQGMVPDGENGEETPGEARPEVLLVEDDEFVAKLVTEILRKIANITWAGSGEDAVQQLSARDWDAIVIDIELPRMSGLELLEVVRAKRPLTATLMLSSHKSFDYAVRAIRAGADDYLAKPVPPDEMRAKITELVATTERRRSEGRQVVLAIGAHPDDVEIGIGGILLRHAAAGDEITLLTLTEGEAGGTAETRRAEARHAAEILSAKLIHADLVDTSVTEGGQTIEAIESVVGEITPGTIYTHTDHDVHQDHRNVHRATMVAARGVPRIYCYQAPSSTVDFHPTRFVGIDDYLDAKLAAIEAHFSQAGVRSYLDEELLRATARYWGRFTRSRFVEPLEVVREADVGTLAGPVPSAAIQEEEAVGDAG